tara:strand:- start:125 stop:679 length:555 start_codon:yes stop_codon:yes gene_type:complete
VSATADKSQPRTSGHDVALGVGAAIALALLASLASVLSPAPAPKPRLDLLAVPFPTTWPLETKPRNAVVALGLFATWNEAFARDRPTKVRVKRDGVQIAEITALTAPEGQVAFSLPPGTYELEVDCRGFPLTFMGTAKTCPLDYPRSGSGWGPGAPPRAASLTLHVEAGQIYQRYAYDPKRHGP